MKWTWAYPIIGGFLLAGVYAAGHAVGARHMTDYCIETIHKAFAAQRPPLMFFSMIHPYGPHSLTVPTSNQTCEALRTSFEWASTRVRHMDCCQPTPRIMSECMPPHLVQRFKNQGGDQ